MAILHCDGCECGTRTFGSDVTGHAYACRERAFQQFVRSHARAPIFAIREHKTVRVTQSDAMWLAQSRCRDRDGLQLRNTGSFGARSVPGNARQYPPVWLLGGFAALNNQG